MHFIYQARLEPSGDGEILVTVPDVPMVASFGVDEAEALVNGADALAMALRRLAKKGEPIPLPAHAGGTGFHPVALGIADAMKIAVILAFREAGLSKTELGRRLGRADSEVHRILDPDHATKIQMLEAALAVLGKRATVELDDAA